MRFQKIIHRIISRSISSIFTLITFNELHITPYTTGSGILILLSILIFNMIYTLERLYYNADIQPYNLAYIWDENNSITGSVLIPVYFKT